MIRNLAVGVLAAAAVLISGCGRNGYSNPTAVSTGGSTGTPPNTVVISNYAFGPADLTVTAGTTVTWVNRDGVAHTATSDNGAWDTGTIPAGGSKSLMLSTAGTFGYHCSVHPSMVATLTVH